MLQVHHQELQAYDAFGGIFQTSQMFNTPHSLRHTFVTLAIDNAAPLAKVQAAARHADPKTTIRYFRNKSNLDDNAVDYIELNI